MSTHYKGSKTETNSLDTFIKLVRACNTVLSDINSSISSKNLTESQFGVLEALLHLGPMPQKQLAAKLLKSGGNITMVVDNLVKRQLVVRKQQSDDRRFFWVHLTAKGEKFIAGIFPDHAKAVAARMSVLSESEQKQLGLICRKLGVNNQENREEKKK